MGTAPNLFRHTCTWLVFRIFFRYKNSKLFEDVAGPANLCLMGQLQFNIEPIACSSQDPPYKGQYPLCPLHINIITCRPRKLFQQNPGLLNAGKWSTTRDLPRLHYTGDRSQWLWIFNWCIISLNDSEFDNTLDDWEKNWWFCHQTKHRDCSQ